MSKRMGIVLLKGPKHYSISKTTACIFWLTGIFTQASSAKDGDAIIIFLK